jgi:sulfofructose kinase
VGITVVDHVLVVDDYHLRKVRTRYHERIVSPGGMVTNALAQAAQLGCETHLLSMVGDDADGRWLASELADRGIETRRLIRDAQFPTTTALILVKRRGGDRRFVLPDRRAIERAAPAFDLTPIRSNSLVLIDGHFPDQALLALRRARECGACVIADLTDARPAYLGMLRFVDYPVLPLEFVESWNVGTPRQTLRALRDRFGGTPIVTLGRRGALALHEDRILEIPAQRVKVRDTTGAGDVFHGAFAAGLYHGLGLVEALHLASRAAGQSCTAVGAMGRLMTRDEMSLGQTREQ